MIVSTIKKHIADIIHMISTRKTRKQINDTYLDLVVRISEVKTLGELGKIKLEIISLEQKITETDIRLFPYIADLNNRWRLQYKIWRTKSGLR